jgi:hypothetical protein
VSGLKPKTYQAKGVSIYYLKTTFLKEVQNYDLEDIRQNESGFIRTKGESVICPRDGGVGAAFVDCVQGEDNVGLANVFLSYAWSNTIQDIVEVLHNFALDKDLDPKRTYVFICFLYSNQFRVAEDKKNGKVTTLEEFNEKFISQIRGCDFFVALVSPWREPKYMTRIWCIYEIFMAIENGLDITIDMPTTEMEDLKRTILKNPNAYVELLAVLSRIKIQDAMASVEEDHVNILKLVEAGGGIASVNIRVIESFRTCFFYLFQEFVNEFYEDVIEENYGGKTPTELDNGYNNMGLFFHESDQSEAAMYCFEKQRELCERSFGKDHTTTLRAYKNLAMVRKE